MAASEGSVSSELKKILRENPSLSLTEDHTRVKCSLTGHEMPVNKTDVIQMYLSCKKYLREKAKDDLKIEKYTEHLEPPKNKARVNQLFCKLTLRHLNNLPHHIEKHVKGKRFQKALLRWEECKRTGEEFKPLGHRQKLRKDEMEEDSDNERPDKEDDLTDLYPTEDFDSGSSPSEDLGIEDKYDDKQGSDFEFEDMDVEPNNAEQKIKNYEKQSKTKHMTENTTKRMHEQVHTAKKGRNKKNKKMKS